jgi:chromosome segregation ATPase
MNENNYFSINLPIDILTIDSENFDSELLKIIKVQNKKSNIHSLNNKINCSRNLFFSRINCINKLKIKSNEILTNHKNSKEELPELNRLLNDISGKIIELKNKIKDNLDSTKEININIEKDKSDIMFMKIRIKELQLNTQNIISEKGYIELKIKEYKNKIHNLNKELQKINLEINQKKKEHQKQQI